MFKEKISILKSWHPERTNQVLALNNYLNSNITKKLEVLLNLFKSFYAKIIIINLLSIITNNKNSMKIVELKT